MKIRRAVQIVFFSLILLVSVGHSLEEAGVIIPLVSSISLHSVCPFGGVVSIYEFFVSGTFVQKIHESSFILMFIVFGLAILLGPVFCGWVCPFGTFQEWISKIGKKIFKKKYNKFIPYSVDKYLRFARYFVLILVIVKTAISAKLMFSSIDPYFALFNIWTDEVAITAYIVLALTVAASLFIERPFCKYFCPYGALLGITNLFKVFKIKRKKDTCINCKMCDNKCPMNIPLSEISTSRNHQCICCLECTSEAACPKSNTMVLAAGKKNGIKSKTVAIIVVSFFVIGIGSSMAFNLWNTKSNKVPQKIQQGAFEGEYNPADIRGSYTFGDIESSFDVPAEILAMAFGLKGYDNIANIQVRSLEGAYSVEKGLEIGTDSIRYFVSLYAGLPYTPEEGTRMPKATYDFLKDKISAEEDAFLKSIIVDAEISSNIQIEVHELESDGVESKSITGNTTLQDLLDWGLSEENLATIFGSEPDDKNMTVKDYAAANGLEFSEVKIAITEKM